MMSQRCRFGVATASRPACPGSGAGSPSGWARKRLTDRPCVGVPWSRSNTCSNNLPPAGSDLDPRLPPEEAGSSRLVRRERIGAAMRRYDDPVDVRRGQVAAGAGDTAVLVEGPEQFLWRGRLWRVSAVV